MKQEQEYTLNLGQRYGFPICRKVPVSSFLLFFLQFLLSNHFLFSTFYFGVLGFWLLEMVGMCLIVSQTNSEQSVLARFSWKFEFIFTILRICVGVLRFLGDNSSIQTFHLLSTIPLAVYFLSLLYYVTSNYYHPQVSIIFFYCGFIVILCGVTNFLHLTLKILGIETNEFYILLFIAVISIPLIIKVFKIRKRSLICSLNHYSPEYLGMQTQDLLEECVRDSNSPFVNHFLLLYNDTKQKRMLSLLSLRKSVLGKETKQFHSKDHIRTLLDRFEDERKVYRDASSLIQLSHLFLRFEKNIFQAYQKLIEAEMIEDFSVSFCIYRAKKHLIDYVHKCSTKLKRYVPVSFGKVIELEMLLKTMKKVMVKVAETKQKFWESLKEEVPDLQKIYQLGMISMRENTEITGIWEKISQICPFHESSLEIYISYLQLVVGETQKAMLYQSKYEDLINSKLEGQQKISNDLFSEINVSVVMSANPGKVGVMLKLSATTKHLFGLDPDELRNQNVSVLMPKLLGAQHTNLILERFRAGHAEGDQQINSFALNRWGYIFPVKIIKYPLMTLKNGFVHIGSIKLDEIAYQNEYILTDEEGNLKGISKYLSQKTGITQSILSEGVVNLRSICPTVNKSDMGELEGSETLNLLIPKNIEILFRNIDKGWPTGYTQELNHFDSEGNRRSVLMEQRKDIIYINIMAKCEIRNVHYSLLRVKVFEFPGLSKLKIENQFSKECKNICKDVMTTMNEEEEKTVPSLSAGFKKLGLKMAAIGVFKSNLLKKYGKEPETETNKIQENSSIPNAISKEINSADVPFSPTDRIINRKLKQHFMQETTQKNKLQVNPQESGILRRLRNQNFENFFPSSLSYLNAGSRLMFLLLLVLIIIETISALVFFDELMKYPPAFQLNSKRWQAAHNIGASIRELILIKNGDIQNSPRSSYSFSEITSCSYKGNYTQWVLCNLLTNIALMKSSQEEISVSVDFISENENRYLLDPLQYPVSFEANNIDSTYELSARQYLIAIFQHSLKIYTKFVSNNTISSEDFSVQNVLKFVMENQLKIFSNSRVGLVNQLEKYSNSHNKISQNLLIITISLLFSYIVILSPFIVYISSDVGKMLNFLVQISHNEIEKRVRYLWKFLALASSKNVQQQIEIEVESETQNEPKIFDETNNIKREFIKYSGNIWKSVLSVLVCSGIIISIYIGVQQSNSSFTSFMHEEINMLSQNTRVLFCNPMIFSFLYQMIATDGEGKCFTSKCADQVPYFLNARISQINQLLVSHQTKTSQFRSEYVSVFDQIMLKNLCSYSSFGSKPNCSSIMGGILQKGVFATQARLYEETYSFYWDYMLGGHNFSDRAYFANDERLVEMEVINYVFLIESLTVLVDEFANMAEIELKNNKAYIGILLVLFIIVLLIITFWGWRKMITGMRRDMFNAKTMLASLPLDIILSCPSIKRFIHSQE